MEDRKRTVRRIIALVMNIVLYISLPYVLQLVQMLSGDNKLVIILQLILLYWVKLYLVIVVIIMFLVFNVKKRPLGKTVLSSSLLNIGMVFVPALIIRLILRFLL